MAIEQQISVGKPLYGGTFNAGTRQLPFVLPGEQLVDDTVTHPSPHRVVPGCVHFGTCGGCQYQHADTPTQVVVKQEILADLLSAAGLTNLPVITPYSAEPWGYRNRIRLRVQVVAGAVRMGYSLRGTNDFLPITMCPIAAPVFWHAAQVLLNLAETDPLTQRWLASTSELELFCLPDESRLQAQFFLRDSDPAHGNPQAFAKFCEGFQAVLPQLAGAGAELDPELSRRARRAWDGATWGASGLSYPVAGRNYWVARGAFFQVNRHLVGKLVDLVCAGHSGALAWDLFAGVGLFTRALAENFTRVVAVEGGELAAAALKIASKNSSLFESIHAPTLDFLRARELQRERPELVVLDPPRAGLGVEGAAVLARIAPARIVYVSCDPTTLARDLAVLVRGGYILQSLNLIDLFPQTYHLETVARLTKS